MAGAIGSPCANLMAPEENCSLKTVRPPARAAPPATR